MRHVLADVSPAAVRAEPYPHILIENALPQELCDRLLRELPPVETVLKGAAKRENARADYTLSDARKNGGVSETWRAFLEANASQAFADAALALFRPFIRASYPDLREGDSVRALKAGVRGVNSYTECEFLLDAGIGVNTPFTSKRPSSVRTAHVDNPRKLFAGLYYLRDPKDDSTGGSFVICRWKKNARPLFAGQHIDTEQVDAVEEVPYRNNTLVFFLNSMDAVHSVTPRQPTAHPRWFLNVLGELKEPLFDIDAYQERGLRKLTRRILGAMNIPLGGVEVRK